MGFSPPSNGYCWSYLPLLKLRRSSNRMRAVITVLAPASMASGSAYQLPTCAAIEWAHRPLFSPIKLTRMAAKWLLWPSPSTILNYSTWGACWPCSWACSSRPCGRAWGTSYYTSLFMRNTTRLWSPPWWSQQWPCSWWGCWWALWGSTCWLRPWIAWSSAIWPKWRMSAITANTPSKTVYKGSYTGKMTPKRRSARRSMKS